MSEPVQNKDVGASRQTDIEVFVLYPPVSVKSRNHPEVIAPSPALAEADFNKSVILSAEH